MDLQDFLIRKFRSWCPTEPEVVSKTKYSIVLKWVQNEPFGFVADQLLYKVEKNNKIPPWIVVYSGGKTIKEIDNLAPRHPHKFRLKVILKSTAVSSLADKALQFYGDENIVRYKMATVSKNLKVATTEINNHTDKTFDINRVMSSGNEEFESSQSINDSGDKAVIEGDAETRTLQINIKEHPWLESQWSGETWTNTDTDGTSSVCFCMAVRCGYIKQVQGMLDERPDLICVINSNNGFTPLATAIRKGDINIVRFLLSAGADVNQASSTGQTPLQLAVLAGLMPIVELLLDKGADYQARDLNGLRVEHYAVDSCDLAMLSLVLDKGGDVTVEDNNVCQGAKTEIVEELVIRGSNINAVDKAGLPLTSVARLLKNRHGHSRDSVLRLVDMSYPHEKALANFTRLTKKIYNVNSLLKMPGLGNKTNLRN